MTKKEINNLKDAMDALDSLEEAYTDFDVRWEKEFGDTDRVIIMSAKDTLEQLKKMEEFK